MWYLFSGIIIAILSIVKTETRNSFLNFILSIVFWPLVVIFWIYPDDNDDNKPEDLYDDYNYYPE